MRPPALLSHIRERKGKYISSPQMKILTSSIVKSKYGKESNIKNSSLVFLFCFGVIRFLLSLFWRRERKSVVHEFNSTSHTINFILFLQFLIHKAALWHHSCALVWKGKDWRHGLFLAYGFKNDMLLNNGSWAENKIEVVVDRWELGEEYHRHTVLTLRTYVHIYG